MDHKLLWVVCTFLLCACYSCVGDSLSVKPTNGPPVERIHFRPRAKVVSKPKDTKKEMLYGSVIWFKPKESTGINKADNGNKVNEVIRLTSRNTNTYRGQNKSTVRNKTTESVKKNDEIGTRTTGYRQVSQAPRRGKSIEQTEKGNEDRLVNEVRRKTPKRTESDPKVLKRDRKVLQNERKKASQITRHQGDKDRTRINSSDQNIKPRNQNPRKPENKRNKSKNDLKENISQNRNVAKNHQNGKEQVLTTRQEVDQTQIDNKDNKITQNIEPKIIEKVKDKPDQKNIENSTESTSIKPTTKPKNIQESKNVSSSDKQKVVKNADMLGMLLAQSDPGLLKVLIDNSSPENLNVFLHNSKITVEELKDIISY